MSRQFKKFQILLWCVIFLAACNKDDNNSSPAPKDPNTAEVVSVDRFSSTAGHLQVRTATNDLPAANAAIDFDKAPFITRGFTKTGQVVDYYNFDVQPTAPAPIWLLFREGESGSVTGNNIIDVIPGDVHY